VVEAGVDEDVGIGQEGERLGARQLAPKGDAVAQTETPDLRAEPRRVRPGADDLEVGAFQRGVARGEGGGEGVERVAVALPVEQTPDADEADGAVARRRELPEPRDGGVAEGHAIANL